MSMVAEQRGSATAEASASLKASGLIVRAQNALVANLPGATMAEPTSSAGAGLLLAKLLPAGAGAYLMVLVDPPANKRELFARLFIGLALSVMLTGTTMDALKANVGWFAFLDRHSIEHVCAVAALWGSLGWFVIGGLSMWAKKWRADPGAAVAQVRDAVKP